MKRKMLVFLMVAVIVLSVVFTACNKDVYIDPATSNEYILVTDENGKKVLSEDGELLVHVTDADGKKVKDDEGNYVTEVHGFIGQIESNGVVEDYAYYFKLPGGWKTAGTGEFENKIKGMTLKIKIEDRTFNDCYKTNKSIYTALSSPEFEKEYELDWKAEWYELDYDNVDSKVCILITEANDAKTATLFFKEGENNYEIMITAPIKYEFEEMKSEVVTVFEALEFKAYTYYEDLTDKPTESEETTVADTTKTE